MIDYNTIPGWIRESLNQYAKKGRPAGGFLEACLANDLRGAFGRADLESLKALHSIVAYIYNHIPSACHGSYETVEKWISGGGADGIYGPGVWEPGEGELYG